MRAPSPSSSVDQRQTPSPPSPPPHRPWLGLKRARGVWDLTTIPLDTDFEVSVKLVFVSEAALHTPPICVDYVLESMEYVRILKRHISVLMPSSTSSDGQEDDDHSGPLISLVHNGVELEDTSQLFEYKIKQGDTIQVVWIGPTHDRKIEE
ncbi:uncharacterized protein BJ171DRAFT_596724 [Polychytrium aggregatum]|uniref:uncharacterized protein n=1 Tax=Polychytrium aggregatum TaxID=110093 RepID=UPI0022FE5D49|nr:uncharacterized protein BJ171DRAFT_596724 [Polychytrium aggregatum]KAI9207128.1 hypothetical protein BJ171DRAFT_596724 [Polychytrium aggregatum]